MRVCNIAVLGEVAAEHGVHVVRGVPVSRDVEDGVHVDVEVVVVVQVLVGKGDAQAHVAKLEFRQVGRRRVLVVRASGFLGLGIRLHLQGQDLLVPHQHRLRRRLTVERADNRHDARTRRLLGKAHEHVHHVHKEVVLLALAHGQGPRQGRHGEDEKVSPLLCGRGGKRDHARGRCLQVARARVYLCDANPHVRNPSAGTPARGDATRRRDVPLGRSARPSVALRF